MSKDKFLSPEQTNAIKQAVVGQYHDQTPPVATRVDGGENGPGKAEDGRAVGYKSPPRSTRFKPGQSGNPKGRPRKNAIKPTSAAAGSGTGNAPLLEIEEAFLSELARTITVNEGGKATELTTEVGLIRAGNVSALKGSALSQKTMLGHALQLGARKAESLEARIKAWREYKARGYETLERIEAGDTQLAAPLPHPDDIILEAGREPHFVGPIVPGVQTILDRLLVRRDHLLIEHVYFERYAPEEAYEREAFQQQLDVMGLERCEHAHVPTGPMYALLQLERALPPRLRWSPADLQLQLMQRDRFTKRELEKRLTKCRKRQRLNLKRGAFYPSAAF